MTIRRISPFGMTMIEVLVATLLSSLMLAAVAGLLGALARQERALTAKRHQPAWQTQFSEELVWDLRNARRYAVTENGVFLEGFGARDFGSDRPTGEPALIQYGFVEAAHERWLVRRETHPADHTNRNGRVDLVCGGAEQLQWGETVVAHAMGTGAIRPSAEQYRGIPDRMELRLVARGAGGPFFHEVLCIR